MNCYYYKQSAKTFIQIGNETKRTQLKTMLKQKYNKKIEKEENSFIDPLDYKQLFFAHATECV